MKVYNNNDSSTGRMSLSKGNQIKMKIDNKWYKADYLGYEGAAEYVSSILAAQTNIKERMEFVTYDLEEIAINDKTFNGCVSKDFLGKDETLITVDRLFKNNLGMSVAEFLKNSPDTETQIKNFVNTVEDITGIKDFGQYLTMLLEWDSFILNEDRHFNNIAFIYNDEKEYYKVSPLFDNGAAFLSDTREDYPLEKSYLGLMSNVDAKPFSKSFDKQVSICQNLYGEQLVLDDQIKIPSEAIDKLNDMYGDMVTKRILDVFEQQKYLTDIPFERGITAKHRDETIEDIICRKMKTAYQTACSMIHNGEKDDNDSLDER